jgi:ferric-dicitrate binding protein FerR (iron transport regulator)
MLAGAPEPLQVATASTSIETYTAPDGSTIRLRPHSTLYRIETDGERRYQLAGEAFFDVTTRPEPFIVEAGALQVQVLGTRFTAHTWGQPAVYLQEGRVRVSTGSDGEPVTLQPGQRSALTADGTLAPPSSADSVAALDWLRQEIAFESEPAASVVAELEQHFDVTIALPDEVARESLSGRIALETPAQSLADLGVVLGGRFERAGDGTYRFVRE